MSKYVLPPRHFLHQRTLEIFNILQLEETKILQLQVKALVITFDSSYHRVRTFFHNFYEYFLSHLKVGQTSDEMSDFKSIFKLIFQALAQLLFHQLLKYIFEVLLTNQPVFAFIWWDLIFLRILSCLSLWTE